VNKPAFKLRRGDIVTVVAPGAYGKPRPALVVQADLFNSAHTSVTVCLMTTALCKLPACRIDAIPSAENGLYEPSQIQVDRLTSLPVDKIGKTIGRLDEPTLFEVTRALAVWLSIA
jgi:mRNA interferase MazF